MKVCWTRFPLVVGGLFAAAVVFGARTGTARDGTVTKRVHAGGEVADVSMYFYFAFPPSSDDIEVAKESIRRASKVLCDASDGAVKITDVELSASPFGAERADVFWYPDEIYGERSFGSPKHPWGTNASYVRIAGGSGQSLASTGVRGMNGQLLAHEMGHSLFGLWDGYDRQRDGGRSEGFGPSMDETETVQPDHNALMRDAGPAVCLDPITDVEMLDGDEPVKCLANEGCQAKFAQPSYCPDTAPLRSELLTDFQFDMAAAGDGMPYPGIRSGDVLNLQLAFRGDTPVSGLNTAADWEALDISSLAVASALSDHVFNPREYIDQHGNLEFGTSRFDGSGLYVGSSHNIHFFAIHMEKTATRRNRPSS